MLLAGKLASFEMIESLSSVAVPQEFQELVERHHQHVADVIARLRTIGLDGSSIEGAVDQLMARFRANLLDAIQAIGGRHV